jgi:hypothetical protein
VSGIKEGIGEEGGGMGGRDDVLGRSTDGSCRLGSVGLSVGWLWRTHGSQAVSGRVRGRGSARVRHERTKGRSPSGYASLQTCGVERRRCAREWKANALRHANAETRTSAKPAMPAATHEGSARCFHARGSDGLGEIRWGGYATDLGPCSWSGRSCGKRFGFSE